MKRMNRGSIKTGRGSNIISTIYPEMGALSPRVKGIARPHPVRGEKQRTSRGR